MLYGSRTGNATPRWGVAATSANTGGYYCESTPVPCSSKKGHSARGVLFLFRTFQNSPKSRKTLASRVDPELAEGEVEGSVPPFAVPGSRFARNHGLASCRPCCRAQRIF